jgi:hypothetical protein
MTAAELRAILAAASERPWKQSPKSSDAIVAAGQAREHDEHYYGGRFVGESIDGPDQRLIVALANHADLFVELYTALEEMKELVPGPSLLGDLLIKLREVPRA